jgi:hypothetical protein
MSDWDNLLYLLILPLTMFIIGMGVDLFLSGRRGFALAIVIHLCGVLLGMTVVYLIFK